MPGCAAPRAVLALLLFAVPAGRAVASSSQISIIQDDARLDADPATTLARARLVGAQVIRVSVHWNWIAPAPNRTQGAVTSTPSDPAAYRAGNWGLWDEIALDAQQAGIRVDFDLMGGAPRWALGPGPAAPATTTRTGSRRRAVRSIRAGDRHPLQRELRAARARSTPLPRVDFWTDLERARLRAEPRAAGRSRAPHGGEQPEDVPQPARRGLALAAGDGPRDLDRHDRVRRARASRGELLGRVLGHDAAHLPARPVLRRLPLPPAARRGGRDPGLPDHRAASKRFRTQNPALFQASGVSDHPYMRWYKPNHELNPDPTNHSSTTDYSSLGVIGNLHAGPRSPANVYGSSTRFPIYNTEFGYITSPPKHSPDPTSSVRVIYLSPATAADYMNWAEYLSWRNPRIRSFQQYLLYDPYRPTRGNDFGGFASGLLTWTGAQKATYYAWRLPLYLPATTARRGHSLEVWGCIRPARFGFLDTGSPQTAEIQFAPKGSEYVQHPSDDRGQP